VGAAGARGSSSVASMATAAAGDGGGVVAGKNSLRGCLPLPRRFLGVFGVGLPLCKYTKWGRANIPIFLKILVGGPLIQRLLEQGFSPNCYIFSF
jgi:hypothetical protein